MDGWMDKQHVRTEEGDKRPRTEGATALRSKQQQYMYNTTQEWPQHQQ